MKRKLSYIPCRSKRGCRVDFDCGHDRRDELEEDNEVEVNAHAIDVVVAVCVRVHLAVATCAPEEPFLLLVFRCGHARSARLPLHLLFDNALIHAFDNLLHDASVLARMH